MNDTRKEFKEEVVQISLTNRVFEKQFGRKSQLVFPVC